MKQVKYDVWAGEELLVEGVTSYNSKPELLDFLRNIDEVKAYKLRHIDCVLDYHIDQIAPINKSLSSGIL